jgi:hypothetical protein
MFKIFWCNGVNSDEIHLKTLYHPAVCYCLVHFQFCPVQRILSSPLLVSHISRFVQSSEFFPAVCYCLAHLQFCPVQWILSSPVLVSHISGFVQSSLTCPGLSSPVNSFQLSLSHTSPVLSSPLLVSHISGFVQSSEFLPAVCYCLAHLQFCPVVSVTV